MHKNIFEEKSSFGFLAKSLCVSFVLGLIITFAVSLLFGYKYKLIGSGSMLPTLSINSIIVLAPVHDYYEDLEVGDIITFKASATSNSGITFTHRIHAIDEETGYYITKGDNRDTVDANPVDPDRVVGKVVANFNFVGYLITYIKSNIILFTFFVIIFLFAWMIFV